MISIVVASFVDNMFMVLMLGSAKVVMLGSMTLLTPLFEAHKVIITVTVAIRLFIALVGDLVYGLLMTIMLLSTLFHEVINVIIAFIHRVSQRLISLFDFAHLTLVFEQAAMLLTAKLIVTPRPLPSFLLRTVVEVWLDLIALVVKLELLIIHVGMLNAELGEALFGIELFHVDVTLLLW